VRHAHQCLLRATALKAFFLSANLLSGPGCPVCVTPVGDIDTAIELSKIPNVIITTFGDMLKVPGSYSSLEIERANGSDVRMVYSSADALELAGGSPGKEVIFSA